MQYKEKKFMPLKHLINAPFIFGMVIPLLLLDITTEIYHQVGFRLCGIPRVKRSNYIKIDRGKLSYLTFFQKIGCVYCGYANGLILYVGEIAARTEVYWCGIMHKNKKNFIPQRYHKDFLKYGDAAGFRNELKYSRKEAFDKKFSKHVKGDE